VNQRFNRNINQALLVLVCLLFGIRAFIPVGFMPDAFGDGWPVRACHDGLPHGLLDAHGENHEASDEEHEGLLEHCSFGVLSAVYSIENEYQFKTNFSKQILVPANDASSIPAARVIAFRSRAPPQLKH